MIRTALYARYSSDLQNAASADDQIRLCRDHAARLGWAVVSDCIYKDEAISGGTILRTCLQQMLDDARAGRFDAVLTEALDRIARDQEIVAHVFKRLTYAGVDLWTVSKGQVDELHIGFEGTMAALMRKDLGAKIRRGQAGNIERGRATGGVSYGYDVVKVDETGEPVRGLRKINEDQADVVRRIYTEFAAGVSARQIAIGLNDDGIPSARGGLWTAATIRGNPARGTGILYNRLYIGKLVGFRITKITDPDTGKQTNRINPTDQHVEQDVPDLRIIGDDLWAVVRQRLEGKIRAPRNRRRSVTLLSGLVQCGVCGSKYTAKDKRRLICVKHQNSSGCSNGRSISKRDLEDRVFAGFKTGAGRPARARQRTWREQRWEFSWCG